MNSIIEMWIPNLPVKLTTLERKFRVCIKKNPKINIFLINCAKLFSMATVIIKNFFEKCIIYLKESSKKLLTYSSSIGIHIIDFIIESPTSIIDLVIYWNQLTKIEIGKTFCLMLISINTVRIVSFLKNLPCDKFFCPNYAEGYQTQLKIIQRLYIQWIMTVLVCMYFIARTASSRIFQKGISILVYKYQISIYFLIMIIWYDLGLKVWFFKRNDTSNGYIIRFVSIKNFKKILKYFYNERYNNRKYTKLEFKIQGNVNFLKSINNTINKNIMISIRLLNSIEENLTKDPITTQSNTKAWKNMDHHIYRKIVDSIDNYSKHHDFTGIFVSVEYKKQTALIDADIILSNWNFIYSFILFGLTLYEYIIEYRKNSKKQEDLEKK
mmetsp:Transcript_20627/g.43343  ORF Transcript_20627/g.43343 Transcript_20627/m.43343 type:complete len:382 (-) Transcript_20627:33-1178(-)